MKKGLFLGSGFSVDFAMPLVWELTEEMRRLIPGEKFRKFNQNWVIEGNGYSEKSVELFMSLYENSEIHYEQIVGGLEVFSNRFENREEREALLGIRSWLMDLIYYLLYPRQIGNVDYNQTTIKMYRGLSSLVENGYPLWIFTLNHDLMVECFAAENNIPLKNGFFDNNISTFKENGNEQNEISFKSLSIDEMEKGDINFFNKADDYGINLLKIHGSLDIFGFNDLKDYLSLHVESPSLATISNALKSLNEIVTPDKHFKVNNEIVLKDKSNTIQFLRRSLLSGVFKFKDNSSQIIPSHFLAMFKRNISRCDELIVIGYGFADQHINEIFKEWLEFSSKRTLHVVSPDIPNLNFLSHLKMQIKYEKLRAIDYVSSLPNGELSAQEKILHEIRNNIRKNPVPAKKFKSMIDSILKEMVQYRK